MVRGPLDVRAVMAALPHRFPMLLIDRVETMELKKSIHAVKAVSINEPFFQGHFPGRPIMPGVLLVEAIAQAAGILAVESLGLAGSGKLVYRSEEHTSELQSLMRISYAVFCLKKKKHQTTDHVLHTNMTTHTHKQHRHHTHTQ